jgi:hypothetical protein
MTLPGHIKLEPENKDWFQGGDQWAGGRFHSWFG